MTLKEITDRLREAGIESAEHDARELFTALSGIRSFPLAGDSSDTPELADAVRRRCEREPLQYVLGEVGFYRETYKVSPAVLIPRADTEHLVDYAVRHLPEGAAFADLCTGSGCIAISTLKNTVGTRAIAVDISADALRVANENAERNGVTDRLTLVRADVLETCPIEPGSLDAVLSNPPYVARGVYAELEPEIYREPEIAFVGGEDGGDFYRTLVPLAAGLIKDSGFIAFEIGYDQADLLRALAREVGMAAEIIKDYSGNDRVAVLRRTENNA